MWWGRPANATSRKLLFDGDNDFLCIKKEWQKKKSRLIRLSRDSKTVQVAQSLRTGFKSSNVRRGAMIDKFLWSVWRASNWSPTNVTFLEFNSCLPMLPQCAHNVLIIELNWSWWKRLKVWEVVTIISRPKRRKTKFRSGKQRGSGNNFLVFAVAFAFSLTQARVTNASVSSDFGEKIRKWNWINKLPTVKCENESKINICHHRARRGRTTFGIISFRLAPLIH